MTRLAYALMLLSLFVPATAQARSWQAPTTLPDSVGARVNGAAVTPDGHVGVLYSHGGSLMLSVTPGLEPTTVGAKNGSGALAAAGTGELGMIWTAGAFPDSHAYFQVWSPASGLGTAVDLGPVITTLRPKLVANAKGDMEVLYEGADYKEYVRFRPADGNFGTPVYVAEQGSADIALSDSGRALVTWTEYVDQREVVWAATRDGDGALADVKRLSSTDAGVDAAGAKLALDASGRGIVAWSEATQGSNTAARLKAATVAADGTWTTATGLDDARGGDIGLGAGAHGDVVLTWESNGDGGAIPAYPYRYATAGLGDGAFSATHELPA